MSIDLDSVEQNPITVGDGIAALRTLRDRIDEIIEAREYCRSEEKVTGWEDTESFALFHEAALGEAEMAIKLIGLGCAMGDRVQT